MELVGAAAAWLLGRLRADAEAGLWSALRGLGADDPLTVALEKVTEDAVRGAVIAAPGGDGLGRDEVDDAVRVLGSVWEHTAADGRVEGTLLGRLRGLTANAMAVCAAPVEDLEDKHGVVSSLSALERDYGLVLDPEQFALELAGWWQQGVLDGARKKRKKAVLEPLAAELRREIGIERDDASHDEVLAAIAALPTADAVLARFDGVARQLDEVLDRIPGQAPPEAEVFPQFVGVPDRNKVFVGRSDELDELAHELRGGGATVITQVAAGLGGVGKTTLAAELCHRERETVDVVRWLAAETREALLTTYVGMGPALGLRLDGLDLDAALARVRGWFETTDRPWLLVFDNAEAPHVLDGLVPQMGGGRVLVTSRYRDWSRSGAQVLRVGVLPHGKAAELLQTLTGRDSDPGAEDLAMWLDGLALAIEQAAAFCRQIGWSFTQYRQHLEQRAGELLARNPAALHRVTGADGHDMVVLTVWDNSIERAATEAPGARAVLDVLAYLGADHVPRALFADPAADEELLHYGDPLYVDEALVALARYSLVDLHRDPAGDEVLSISLHRLLQEVIRLSHRDQAESTAPCASAVRLLERSWPVDSTDPNTWATCRLLEPHVLAVGHHADRLGIEQTAVSWLLDRYATYLQYAGNPLAAVVYFEQAVQTHAQVAAEDDVGLLMRQANLGNSYWSAGRFGEAIALLGRVVVDCERILGDDHSGTLTARANLANSYRSVGRFGEALALEERVVVDCERILGDEHLHTLTARVNLAGSYWSVGRFGEALALEERVVVDRERILGDEHPGTLNARSNLANSYWSVGRFDEALALEERVVVDRERILGDEHPGTLTARNNLAHSYWSVGRFGEAIALLERVVVDSERILSDEHPDTVASRETLASWKAG